MRTAVITPYYKESRRELERCINSVLKQRHPCTHFLVSDGSPRRFIDRLPVRHVLLGSAHSDNGDTPRGLGSQLAVAEGFDAITYLDADNYFLPDHISNFVKAHRKDGGRAHVLTSGRVFIKLDGTPFPGIQDEDRRSHVDTSCFFLTRKAFDLAARWTDIPKPFSSVCDRLFYQAVRAAGHPVRHLPGKTLAFTVRYACAYSAAGLPAPKGTKDISGDVKKAFKWWEGLRKSEKVRIRKALGFDPLILLLRSWRGPAAARATGIPRTNL